MYEYPFGNGQQLNLDWFLSEWKNLLAAWEAEKNGIEGALQAEIDRAEAALADVLAARDAAAQSAANALESKNAAAQSASDASGYLATVRADANTASNAAQNAAQSESNAAESAQTALASKNNAANSERNAAQSEANANSSKNAAAQSAADALANKNAAAQSAANALESKNAAAQSAEDASDAAASVEESAQRLTILPLLYYRNENNLLDYAEPPKTQNAELIYIDYNTIIVHGLSTFSYIYWDLDVSNYTAISIAQNYDAIAEGTAQALIRIGKVVDDTISWINYANRANIDVSDINTLRIGLYGFQNNQPTSDRVIYKNLSVQKEAGNFDFTPSYACVTNPLTSALQALILNN